jgi:hypothetical protein
MTACNILTVGREPNTDAKKSRCEFEADFKIDTE